MQHAATGCGLISGSCCSVSIKADLLRASTAARDLAAITAAKDECPSSIALTKEQSRRAMLGALRCACQSLLQQLAFLASATLLQFEGMHSTRTDLNRGV